MLRLGAAMVGCAVVGYFPFVRGTRVPVLGLFDLGIHELGHMLFIWAGHTVHFIMGSVFQVIVPAGLAVAFLIWRNWPAAAFLVAWTGASMADVAVYIADAPYERLQLIGGEHDWATLLWEWGRMDQAATIAGVVNGTGMVLVAVSLVMCVLPAFVDGLWSADDTESFTARLERRIKAG